MKSRLPVLATEGLFPTLGEQVVFSHGFTHGPFLPLCFCYSTIFCPNSSFFLVFPLRIYLKRVITPFINSFAKQSKLF